MSKQPVRKAVKPLGTDRRGLPRSVLLVATGAVEAEALGAGQVTIRVDVSALLSARNAVGDDAGPTELPRLSEALSALVGARLAEEFDTVVAEYRRMLRESLATWDDSVLQAALNKARIQEKLIAGVPMVDQAQACELLGLSRANPSATMKRKEGRREILRFRADGRAVYPLFQFEIEHRRIYPALKAVLQAAPEAWSDYRILHWLTRPHANFDTTPADQIGLQPDAVLTAFRHEIEPTVHG